MTLAGAAVPIVFINGLFDVFPIEQARRRFAPRVVLSPDLLGYGEFRDVPGDRITMESQADHVAAVMRQAGIASAHLVGQSVGGVIAFLIAKRHPGSVASVISVEGNFTLDDAFWSRSIAAMHEAGVLQVLEGLRADPADWLRKSGIEPSEGNLEIAKRALSVPPHGLRAMARCAVAATEDHRFVEQVEALMNAGLEVRLIAGERSRDGWHVPDAIARRAGGVQVVRGAGHLMMLEAPPAYFDTIEAVADGIAETAR